MEINNLSASANINNVNAINLNTANRAFENSKKELEKQNNEIDEIKQEDISLIENRSTPPNVADIQKYADYMGEKLSIDDINYGLMYGRSVIVDYSA